MNTHQATELLHDNADQAEFRSGELVGFGSFGKLDLASVPEVAHAQILVLNPSTNYLHFALANGIEDVDSIIQSGVNANSNVIIRIVDGQGNVFNHGFNIASQIRYKHSEVFNFKGNKIVVEPAYESGNLVGVRVLAPNIEPNLATV